MDSIRELKMSLWNENFRNIKKNGIFTTEEKPVHYEIFDKSSTKFKLIGGELHEPLRHMVQMTCVTLR